MAVELTGQTPSETLPTFAGWSVPPPRPPSIYEQRGRVEAADGLYAVGGMSGRELMILAQLSTPRE